MFSYAGNTYSPNDNNIVLTSRLWSMNCQFLLVSICAPWMLPPTAPFSPIHHYERNIWSVAQADGFLLTSGSTLPSSLKLPLLHTGKRCGSLIWPVFLWDPSWGRSDNEQMRVLDFIHTTGSERPVARLNHVHPVIGEIPVFLACPDVDPMHSPKIGYSLCSQ